MTKLDPTNCHTDLSQIRPDCIVSTIEKIEARIASTLPNRNLSHIASQLQLIAINTAKSASTINKPNIPLRAITVSLILAMISIITYLVAHLHFTDASAWEILEGADAAISSVIYIGIATIFFITLEARLKRRKALKALHQLRVIAHIIDMHQLTKDPEHFVHNQLQNNDTTDFNNLTPYKLGRYLDYCSELLSMTSKIAALYAQNTQDSIILASVNEIEHLSTGLSRKIWQKIMILDQHILHPHQADPNNKKVDQLSSADFH
ncbi:hypothetical protein JD969_19270 [Planctomycetota bacterium]|nr:hypothetical protein JD969_19270 [Planctomycetota bacterium]